MQSQSKQYSLLTLVPQQSYPSKSQVPLLFMSSHMPSPIQLDCPPFTEKYQKVIKTIPHNWKWSWKLTFTISFACIIPYYIAQNICKKKIKASPSDFEIQCSSRLIVCTLPKKCAKVIWKVKQKTAMRPSLANYFSLSLLSCD